MEVHLDGLTVRAPRWVTLRDIEAALVERAAWIVRSLDEWRARRRDVMPREWKSGAPIVFRGEALTLAVYPARHAEIGADLFHVTVRHPRSHDERQVAGLRRRVAAATRRGRSSPRASRITSAVARTARRRCACRTRAANGAAATRTARSASTGGSCSCRRLLAEYVVAHEVAHIVELNHSARFWAVVETLLPGHAALRRELDDWTALLVH